MSIGAALLSVFGICCVLRVLGNATRNNLRFVADSERMRRFAVKLPPTPKHGVGLFTRLVKDSEPVWMGTPSIYWAFPLVEVYLCPSKSAKS